MKTIASSLLLVLLFSAPLARGQGTAFTYQGRLSASGNPANGNYDMQIGVYDVANGASAIAGPLILSAVPASNGLFIVTLDFGTGVFSGNPRWLQIGVRSNGTVGAFTASHATRCALWSMQRRSSFSPPSASSQVTQRATL